MTIQQSQLIQFITDYYKKHKYPPKPITMRRHFNRKAAQITQQLNSLIKKGLLTNPDEGIYLPVDISNI